MPTGVQEGWVCQKGSRGINRGADERGGSHGRRVRKAFWFTHGPRVVKESTGWHCQSTVAPTPKPQRLPPGPPRRPHPTPANRPPQPQAPAPTHIAPRSSHAPSSATIPPVMFADANPLVRPLARLARATERRKSQPTPAQKQRTPCNPSTPKKETPFTPLRGNLPRHQSPSLCGHRPGPVCRPSPLILNTVAACSHRLRSRSS